MKSPICKPLLAAAIEDTQALTYPCHVTPKVDGIRALVVDGAVVSRQFKSIRNRTIERILGQLLPEGSDGEITVGTTFAEASSAVMRGDGSDEFGAEFTFHWFDLVADSPDKPYLERIEDMRRHLLQHPAILLHPQAHIVPLFPAAVPDARALEQYEERVLDEGFEGVMVRAGTGRYKPGRSTVKEGILLKLKRFRDGEAIVTGVRELVRNGNDKTRNALGETERSAKRAGLVGAGTLGALSVRNVPDAHFGEVDFSIGTGFTAEMRADIWARRAAVKGSYVKYKFVDRGTERAPRFPVFLGFRDVDDM